MQEYMSLFVKDPQIDSCRRDALRTLLQAAGNSSTVTNDDRLLKARKCWEDALTFYLSYPMDFTFGSHVIPLLASMWVSDGAILELGSGWYSTPMMHRISTVQGRNVLTADSKYEWLKYFLFFVSNKHDLYLVNVNKPPADDIDSAVRVVSSWDAIGQQQQHWGFIFVDHAPAEQRIEELERLRHRGDLILVHDTEPEHDGIYQVQKHLSTFKYRMTFGPGWTGTHTDVLSESRPELVQAVQTLSQWSIDLLKHVKN